MCSVTSENILEMREEIQKTLEIRNNLSWKKQQRCKYSCKSFRFQAFKNPDLCLEPVGDAFSAEASGIAFMSDFPLSLLPNFLCFVVASVNKYVATVIASVLLYTAYWILTLFPGQRLFSNFGMSLATLQGKSHSVTLLSHYRTCFWNAKYS